MPNLGSPVTGGSYAKYYSNDGQGGLHETATDTTLLATATYLLQEGMLFYVASSANNGNAPTYYQLNAGFHNPLVIGDFSIFGGGSGPDPAWAAQTAWFIDPVSGSDASDGLTIGTALKTWAEYRRRMLAVGGSHPTGKVTTTILSSLLATDPMIVDWAVHTSDYSGWGALVQGVTTQVRTGSITGYISRNPAINQSNVITDSGVTSWADDVGSLNGHIVHFTSGAATGCYAWIAKDLGSGSARLTTVFLASPEDVQGPETQPSVGDTYEILSFPSIPNYFYAPLIGDNWDMLFLNMGSVSYSEGWIGGSNYNQFNECAFVPPYWNGGSFDTENCCIKGAIDSNNATSGWIDGGVIDDIFSQGGEIEDASDICFVGGVIMQGCSMIVIDGGYVRADDVAVFDSPGDGIYVRDARLRSNDGMWGSGNAGSGFGVGQGAKVELIYGNQSITGTSGDVYFCGATLTWAEVSAQSYIQSLSTSSSISPNADNAGLTYIVGAGGLQTVPDDATMLATIPRFLQEGMIFYVKSSASNLGAATYYKLNAGWHNPLVIGDFSITNVGGGNSTWATQTAWFIDPVSGNDNNDGSTIGTALFTWTELRRRMLFAGGHASSTIITILSDLLSTDHMLLDWAGANETWNVVQGTVNIIRSSTLTGFTAMDILTSQPNVVIDSTVTDWTSDIGVNSGHALQFTSGAAIGAVTWIDANATGGGAIVSEIMDEYGTTYIPATGDSYEILSFPAVPAWNIFPTKYGQWDFLNLNFGNDYITGQHAIISPAAGLFFTFCAVAPGYLDATNNYYYNCALLGAVSSNAGGVQGLFMGGISQEGFNIEGTGTYCLIRQVFLDGQVIEVSLGATANLISNAFINQQYSWAAIMVSNATVYTQGNWGFTGNIVPGIYVASGANVTLGGGDTVMGTQGGLQFLQTIYSWANLPSYIVSRDTFTKLTTGSTSANDILNSNGTVQVTANTPIAVSYPTITASNVVLLSLRVGIGNTLTPSVTVQPGTGFTVASYYGDTSTYAWVVL